MSTGRGGGAVRSTLLVAFVLALGACSTPEPSKPPSSPATQPSKPAALAKAVTPAVLTGSVSLATGAQLPMYQPEEMERKILDQLERGTLPEVCPPPKTTDRTPVRTTPDGKLIGVMVTVSDFKKNPERAPRIYDVVIQDCRLTPSIVVAMLGDTLRIRNEVQFPFMPGYGKDPVLKTLIPGQTKEVLLQEPGVSPVQCGFTAPCGRTDVVVLHHPLYAVTGEDGTFRIEGFPPDEQLTVSAWHPLFNASEQKLKLGQGEQKALDFTLTPAR